MTRGHVGTARSSSTVASSDGHDISRFVESGSTTWMLLGRQIFIGGARHSPIFLSLGRDVERFGSLDRPLTLILIRRLGRLVEEINDRGAIEPRSRWDRAAIVAPSARNHIHDHQTTFIGESRLRSTHDRGPIVARLWHDRGAIVVLLKRNSSRDCSHDATQENRSHDPCNPLPRPHQSATIFGLNFPLKAYISLLIFSTFDRFVK